MIELKYYEINHPHVDAAFGRLQNTPMDSKLAYNFHKIFTDWNALRKTVSNDYHKEIVEKFAELKDGAVQPDPENPQNFLKKEGVSEEDMKAAHEEFSERTAVIERAKIDIICIKDMKLSPKDFSVLEPILFESPIEDP